MIELITSQKSVNSFMEEFASGNIGVPEIQRDIVWDTEQIKELIDSIQSNYPCGSIILWEPREKDAAMVRAMIRPERLEQFQNKLPKYFLLDGQQRLTALASIFLDRELLKKLLFELEEEMPFIVVHLKNISGEKEASDKAPSKEKNGKLLINYLFQAESNIDWRSDLSSEQKKKIDLFIQSIKDYQFPIQIIRGCDYPTVGKIFARINSQGTALTGAEIHLANIVPRWKGITKEFRDFRSEWHSKWYEIELTFLLRLLASLECDTPNIQKFADKIVDGNISVKQLNQLWDNAQKTLNTLINILRDELLLDKSKFFVSKNVLIPLAYYIHACKLSKKPVKENLVKRYFLISQLAGTYSSSGDSVLKKAVTKTLLEYYNNPTEGLKILVDNVENEARWEGYRGLKIIPKYIEGAPNKNIFTLLMYIMLRKNSSLDFLLDPKVQLNEIEPKKLHLHHIFPYNYMVENEKKLLNKFGLTRHEFRTDYLNSIANITIISGTANLAISDRSPLEYLNLHTTKENRKKHCIPENKEMWQDFNFLRFLNERKKLLSVEFNKIISSRF